MRRMASLRSAMVNRRSRLSIGQRVRVVGGQRIATVTGIVAGSRIDRYRIDGSGFLYFPSDLEALP